MPRIWTRRLWRQALAVGACLALIVATAHLAVVRSAVLKRVIAAVGTGTGARLEVREFSYNLATLRTHVGGLTATADGASVPFLSVESADIDLAWRSVVGLLAFERLTVGGVTVDLIRGADGALNLPRFERGGPGSRSARVPVGALDLSRVQIRYRDPSRALEARLAGLTVQLAPASPGVIAGPLAAGSGLVLRSGDRSLSGTLGGRLSYDGSTLSLDGLTYAGPPGPVRIDGRLETLWAEPAAHLTLAATLSVREIFDLLSVDTPPSGSVTIRGAIEGTLAAPTATASVTSQSLRWRHLVPDDVSATVLAGTDEVRLNHLSLRIGGGVVEASGRFDVDERRVDASAEWRRLPLRALVEWPQRPPVDTLLSGRAQVGWDVDQGLGSLQGEADARGDAPPLRQGLGVSGTFRLEVRDRRWTARSDQLFAGRVAVHARLRGELDAGSLWSSSLGGTLDASVDAAALPAIAQNAWA